MIEAIPNTFLGVPEFIWNNIFTVVTTLICGLIVAYFTSTFLKKKEERTRINGLIVEKRIESEQAILHFLEQELTKEQIICRDKELIDLIVPIADKYPYMEHLQYSKVFSSRDDYEEFFYKFEEMFSNHKLWLDEKVRLHLMLMQAYFSWIDTIPIIIKSIHLPKNKTLTDSEFKTLCDKFTLLYGILLDNEINGLITKLDELIVKSVYKLDLKCPKKSLSRNGMLNSNIKSILKKLEKRTILGMERYELISMIIKKTLETKKIDYEKLTEEEKDNLYFFEKGGYLNEYSF